MSDSSFFERLFLAWRTFFRIVFDPAFAARLRTSVAAAGVEPHPVEAALPVAHDRKPAAEAAKTRTAPVTSQELPEVPSASDGALQLLTLFQREGRLIDFLQQDVAKYSDAQIGQAARVVHEGCRATLERYLRIEPVIDEPEGRSTTVEPGFNAAAIKLLGSVSGSAPYRGTLRHKGWRAASITLPETLTGHEFEVLAPAEVELG